MLDIMDVKKIRVLFICSGNVCRSPLAASMLWDLVKKNNLASSFDIDSAGTENYHVGTPQDPRSVKVALNYGVKGVSHIARQFTPADFDNFDYLLVMDHLNYDAVISNSKNTAQHAKVMLLRTFDKEVSEFYDMPDPYYGTEEDFAELGEAIKRSCLGFLEFLKANGKL